jgi:hypothetical protein
MSSALVDPVDFVRGTVTPMAASTFPYITSIVAILSETDGEHVGSGFRCMLGGRHAVVTAHHVALQAAGAALGAAYAARRGERPTRLPTEPALVDADRDLSVLFVDPSEAPDVAWWAQENIDTNIEARTHDYLFVHGFPGARARFVFSAQNNRSLPYGVMERDDDLPSDVRPHELAMDYDPKNLTLESGMPAELVDPSGLSGSPVWRIGAYGRSAASWQPLNARLVGVVTRWNHDKRVLLATGVEHLLRLVGSARK